MNESQYRQPDEQAVARKVQRHSHHRLLPRPIELPGGLVVSAERH